MTPATSTYTFTRWSGRTDRVTAQRVEFTTAGGLTFWTGTTLILAIQSGDWNNLKQEPAG